MEPVWVMSEEEKIRVSIAFLVVLVVLVVIWGWTWLFPSEASRLSDACSAQNTITRNEQALRSTLDTVKSYKTKTPLTGDDFTRAGRELERAKKLVSESTKLLATLRKHASGLKKSSNVSTQLQALGYEKFAGEAQGRLDAFATCLSEVEQALSANVE